MLDKIPFRWPIFSRQTIVDSEELTSLELVGRSTQKVNDIIDLVNTFQNQLDSKENSDNITNNRKLSLTGNFTGTLNGESIIKVLTDIASSLSLVLELEDIVNNSRDALGYIIDGGLFTQTDPADFNLDGGIF